MKKAKKINFQKEKRAKRARAKIFGTKDKPRLSVFRSNNFTYVQLIDDDRGQTLASAHTERDKAAKVAQSEQLGKKIAEQAKKLGVKRAVFDKGPYKYHGRVKAVAEGARQAGLKI